MSRAEQIVFINELIGTVKKEILSKKLPLDWDGIELRWLIAEKFSQVVFGGYKDKRKKRYKDFDHTLTFSKPRIGLNGKNPFGIHGLYQPFLDFLMVPPF